MEAKLIKYNILDFTDENIDAMQDLYNLGTQLYLWATHTPFREGLTENGQGLDSVLHQIIQDVDNVLVIVPYPDKKPTVLVLELDAPKDGFGYYITNIEHKKNESLVEYERLEYKPLEEE